MPAAQASTARTGPRVNLAVAEAIAGIALLSVMDAIIKGVAARYPVIEVAFMRFAVGAVVIGAILAVVRPGWPSRETLVVNGGRAILVVSTATTFFYALSTLPLAETLALSFLAPVFIAGFGALILGERIDRRIVGALVAGFVGMLVIVSGKAGGGSLEGSALTGAIAAVASAVTYALAMVLLRARAAKDPVVTIVALQNGVSAAILAIPAAFVWVTPTAADAMLFAAIGSLGVIGHLLLSRAFAKAEAARLAPLEYTALVWAVLLGFVFFGEMPTLSTLAGAALIVGGALIASRR
ncbi:DMT family transporter [Salinarimonas soli]|uniref:DMT family transporter n=1 Tax=Salinarimonas soli TaxID=1638099 RepID=A0A5B2W0Q9_9HYPH|nr:DMT family transporter [Salinarimonas soli]KAA2244310.1 DMT family transporter [Salinarimonas soli]